MCQCTLFVFSYHGTASVVRGGVGWVHGVWLTMNVRVVAPPTDVVPSVTGFGWWLVIHGWLIMFCDAPVTSGLRLWAGVWCSGSCGGLSRRFIPAWIVGVDHVWWFMFVF